MANIDDKKIPVGTTETPIVGRLHDVSEDHVVTGANEVFDDAFGERQSQINDKLRHYTKMAHIRIDAEEITREHNDNLLNEQLKTKQLEVGAVETDIEPILESPNMLPSGAVAFNLGWYKGNDNPEWVYCITDGAMRVLAGIKKDGSVEWMVGIPTPVKNYVDAHIQELIKRLEELEEHILEELEKKVDKEEGKGIIPLQYAEEVENPEFVRVVTDNEGKILYGVKTDGTFYFGAGVPRQIIDYVIEHTNATREELLALIDTKVNKEEGKSLIDAEYADGVHYVEKPDFLDVKIDNSQRLLEGTMINGTKVFTGDVEIEKNLRLKGKVTDTLRVGKISQEGTVTEVLDNLEYLEAHLDKKGRFLYGVEIDGTFNWSKGVPKQITDLYGAYENNPEYIWVVLDKEKHILFGIKRNGDIVYGSQNTKNSKRSFIVSKGGNGDYTSLSKAILDNMGIWGITLYVNEGEYDLIEELEEYYGTVNFLPLTPLGRGLELGYDITIKGSPNAVIKANYSGSSRDMQELFSPFNAYMQPNVGGFSLIGVNVQCSRVRYCVHDEKGTNGTGTYNNIYDNCSFYIDNTNNSYWHSSQCIGGGLGHSGSIIIRNCIFEQIEPVQPNNACVSYHNCKSAGAKSFISCTNNYVKGNRGFRFSWYGQSEEITQIICSGNNVGRSTIFRPETSSDSPFGPSDIRNMELYDWNNTIRI